MTHRSYLRLLPATVTLLAVLSAGLLSSGCTTGVLYYETEKFSLTLEGKPADATEPVTGNLGVKQRVAAVVPRRISNGDTKKSEGVSVVGFFDLKRVKDQQVNWLVQPVEFLAAFVTGQAAVDLEPGKAAASLDVLTNISPGRVRGALLQLSIVGQQLGPAGALR